MARSYVMHLQLEGQPATLSGHTKQHIELGDEVAVAGFRWFGTVHGLAYKNVSKNIVEGGGFLSSLVLGLVLFSVSFMLTQGNLRGLGVIQFSDPFFTTPFRFMSIITRYFGGWVFLQGWFHFLAFLSVKDLQKR